MRPAAFDKFTNLYKNTCQLIADLLTTLHHEDSNAISARIYDLIYTVLDNTGHIK